MCIVCKGWNWNVWRYVTHFDSRLEPPAERYLIDRLHYDVANTLLARLDKLRVKTLYFAVKDDDVIEE
jgi:hypothetical protein